MKDDGASNKYIKNADEKRKKEIDDFMGRTTLEQNTLKHLKDCDGEIKPIQVPELRIILVGKVC